MYYDQYNAILRFIFIFCITFHFWPTKPLLDFLFELKELFSKMHTFKGTQSIERELADSIWGAKQAKPK